MSNFIGLAYAVVKQAGYNTNKMSTDEVVDKYNELQKKTGQKEATPKEQQRLQELGIEDKPSNKGVNDGKARKEKVSKRNHEKTIKELSSDKYPDGTYDLESKEPIEYEDGYQATFCQIGDNYTEEEHAKLCEEFLKESTDDKISAGKFGGRPEISFHIKDRETAERLAKKYNQISIWDWKEQKDIKTGGTGERR